MGLHRRRGFLGNAGRACQVQRVLKDAWRCSTRLHDVAKVLVDSDVVLQEVAALRAATCSQQQVHSQQQSHGSIQVGLLSVHAMFGISGYADQLYGQQHGLAHG